MKKTTYLWLLLVTFAFVACGGAKSKLVGNWEVQTRNGKPVKEIMLLEFKKDDTFTQSAGKQTRKGKWELAKDSKSVNLYPDGGKSEVMTIVKMEADNILLKDDKTEYGMKKRK